MKTIGCKSSDSKTTQYLPEAFETNNPTGKTFLYGRDHLCNNRSIFKVYKQLLVQRNQTVL